MTTPLHDATRLPGLKNWGVLTEARQGIMLHFDASASDKGATAWLLRDPKCKVSYNWIVLDDGAVQHVAPSNARAWHAGNCRPSNPDLLTYKDANSAFYGIAAAAKPGDRITKEQRSAITELCHTIFVSEGWTADLIDQRITSHHLEAWPRGRKADIKGVLDWTLEGARLDLVMLFEARRTA